MPEPLGDPPGLAPYAERPSTSRGRQHGEHAPDLRNAFQRDRDRIIHSSAFRRLEYKTQVFVNHEGDLFRTRLTHTLEVAQIARTIARALALNEDLTEAIALAHDLGHTAFGHAGQDALDACMAEHGGFEHNLQSLRVVDLLEARYPGFDGLNLTFETREGLVKRCPLHHAERLGDIGRRFLDGTQPGLEAQLTNIADEIAYNSHDIDDGLRAGLLTVSQLREVPLVGDILTEVTAEHPDLGERRLIYAAVRRLIGHQVRDLVDASRARIDAAAPASPDAARALPEPLVGFSDAMRERHQALKAYLYEHLYRHYRVHRMTTKAARVVRELFTTLFGDPRLLPPQFRADAEAREARRGDRGRARAVADYIAGMTDRFALDEHERLHTPKRLT
ncbi:deoxyguanosinetriphosphate triphosphohydrolase [Sediminicurvatus halobius]|uniref:Deoxyguanosinetriphosphate triphosphohydrolase-like protein n=1 Tax=Sediminicurvatus halobius TaxID=2182432 RepID=A0A2U2N6T4_9GAMM|nr:deoxyguanosinetriphosphate triphosphohydrolase [Spiribacter halobius]PWG64820.1 deoxyguanosinetriphosphate triphosphohydrolase [Spiribacter halobius]UEX78327.1 deoxyguanosinetriphosphate triphosphohydrolase [Spiribacter halobius]